MSWSTVLLTGQSCHQRAVYHTRNDKNVDRSYGADNIWSAMPVLATPSPVGKRKYRSSEAVRKDT